ncbi:unnamed protein product [Polarella glacialis]|uniref:Protein kinase domain-containing protein n=1 Tax=Polarella glacialis TaxID=89957 RepID=A0A813GF52_POLGL|nr:unnamed protein product [Polarella glacialis]
MGCSSSSAGTTEEKAQGGEKRLLDEYIVGKPLGEGAFGVVKVCTKRTTGEEFAVKMVDKVETPVAEIQKEAEMLQSLSHPNVVQFLGVFYEKCFVCIVMSKLDGGDLVEGLQDHLQTKGQIDPASITHVSFQMADSINYLHTRSVIHRDIKGDNFLLSCKDLTRQDCKIVLTDFGTATQCQPKERLSKGVGTKIFWSPELYDFAYGLKVDVWAMGVIMYGLTTGRFPFRDDNDIKYKDPTLPKRVNSQCQNFIQKLLEKKEVNRLSAAEALAHPWVAGSAMAKEKSKDSNQDETIVVILCDAEADNNPDGTDGGTMSQDTADEGVTLRRHELIGRLVSVHSIQTGGTQIAKMKSHRHKKFNVEDKDLSGGKAHYEFLGQNEIAASKLLEPVSDLPPAPQEDPMDVEMLKRTLLEHKIDPSKFGVGNAKDIKQFADEVQKGAARLMLDAAQHKKLVRVVDVVALKLRPAKSSQGEPTVLLIETQEQFPDGRKRATVRLPGTKKEPYENVRQTADRILREMLGMHGSMVTFDLTHIERQEEERDSPSFPGVQTVYRKEIIECRVRSTETDKLSKVGLPGLQEFSAKDSTGNTKFFQWISEKEAAKRKVNLTGEAHDMSTLVQAPIGLAEEPLRAYLTTLGVPVQEYGQNGARSMKEFSSELIKGQSRIAKSPAGENLVVTEIVVLIIYNPKTKETLVHTQHTAPDGTVDAKAKLPGSKRRPDDNQFLAAHAILRNKLEIDENAVVISQDVRQVDAPTTRIYPGLKSVYRKRVIRVQFAEDADNVLLA